VLWFLGKRILWMILTLWIVFTLTFVLMHAVPGGPYSDERNLPPEQEANLRASMKLDEPYLVQYWDHLSSLLVLDFKQSYRRDAKVRDIIEQGFPVSASLGIFAMVFALSLGTTAGVVSAVRRNSIYDVGFMTAATVGIAVPNFILASLAIVAFVFALPLFPAGGWGSIQQLLLPALCLGAPFAAYIARLTRTGMMEVLGLDYIRTAHAKGLSERRVVVRHALRGAILPVVSFLGPATAGILTGSLVLEKIFALPGMGSHFIEGALTRDYTLAMGMVLVYTVLLFSMNTLVDLSYSVIDPRVKAE
jgi:ABC-type dipeptide/oligopeptide/nickel transport system permease component